MTAPAACPRCSGTSLQRWGRANGLQRYRCTGCARTFNALTGTPLARLRRRDLWLDHAQVLNEGLSVRSAGRRLGVHYNTTFRWRHRWLQHPRELQDRAFTGVVELDTVVFRDCQGGTHRWCRVTVASAIAGPSDEGPQCSSGGSARGRGRQIDVLLARDRAGAMRDAVLPRLDGPALDRVLGPILDRSHALVFPADAPAYRLFATTHDVRHHALASAFPRSGQHPPLHLETVRRYAQRLARWMERFQGVSARHLENYLGWRRLLDRHRRGFAPLQWLRLAVGRTQQPTVTTRRDAADVLASTAIERSPMAPSSLESPTSRFTNGVSPVRAGDIPGFATAGG